jgi:hypothetical protein
MNYRSLAFSETDPDVLNALHFPCMRFPYALLEVSLPVNERQMLDTEADKVLPVPS